jgi:DNA-binding response OmpR family regulator
MSSPRKLLVVDDDPNARNALGELLRDEGFEVEVARHGVEALVTIAKFHPAVVITDVEMPCMDGVELVANMQLHADRPSVIVMTSFGETSRALAALRAGATSYLTKPIRFDELLVVLAKVIRMHDMENAHLLRAGEH